MKKTPAQKARHLKHAAQYIKLQRKAKKAWNDLVEREHMRVFGRPFEITDYKISGIARDEYAQPVKTRLRALAHKSARYGDQAVKHWKAAGKRMHISRLKDSIKNNPSRRGRSDAMYWVQKQAKAGNWYDSLGTDNLERAKSFARYEAENGDTARVVSRHDEVLHVYAATKKNPSRRVKKSSRIHRPNIRLTAYVTRPSQITRKKPSKRLVKRRRKVQARPAKGYFPNPKGIKVLVVETRHGKTWKKRVMYDTRKFANPANTAFGSARVYAKIEKVPARVVVRYVDAVKQAITSFA